MQALHCRFEIDAEIDQAAKLVNARLDHLVDDCSTVIRRTNQRIVDVVFEATGENVLQILFRKLSKVDGWTLDATRGRGVLQRHRSLHILGQRSARLRLRFFEIVAEKGVDLNRHMTGIWTVIRRGCLSIQRNSLRYVCESTAREVGKEARVHLARFGTASRVTDCQPEG